MTRRGPENDKGTKWLSPRVTACILASIGLFVLVVGAARGDENQALQPFGIVGLGILILGILFPNVKSIRLPGGIEAKMHDLAYQVDLNTRRIQDLLLLAMSSEVYSHLKNLEQGQASSYVIHSHVRRELEHLRHSDYIGMNDVAKGVRDIPTDEPVNLTEFIHLTDRGKTYLKLRKMAEESR